MWRLNSKGGRGGFVGSQNVSTNVVFGRVSRDTILHRLVDQQLVAERRGKSSAMPADRYAVVTFNIVHSHCQWRPVSVG